MWTTKIIAVIILQNEKVWLYNRGMGPKDAEWIANIVDPDQTGPAKDSLIWV